MCASIATPSGCLDDTHMVKRTHRSTVDGLRMLVCSQDLEVLHVNKFRRLVFGRGDGVRAIWRNLQVHISFTLTRPSVL